MMGVELMRFFGTLGMKSSHAYPFRCFESRLTHRDGIVLLGVTHKSIETEWPRQLSELWIEQN